MAEESSAPPAETPAPAPAPAAEVPAKESSAKPTSSKKAAPPKKTAGPRSSTAGGSKKNGAKSTANGEKSFSTGDIVLARLKGYPAWPARIADPEAVPKNVLDQRQGKSSSVYCCQFFPVGDYAWLHAREINTLTPDGIESYLKEGHRSGKDLRIAYETAAEPTEWIANQDELRAGREADEAQQDELADEDEAEASGGKRKRAAPSKKSQKKKAKVEKSKAEVESEEEGAKPKSKAKAAKPKSTAAPKSSKKEPQAAPADEKPADDDPLASDPQCVKVKDWRHRLQRAFLGKGLPAADEMGVYDALFKTIENYEEITLDALSYSKIGKVMKKIATLEGIPRNDELRITDRAAKLMNEWSEFINKNESKANGKAPTSEKKEEPSAEKTEEKTTNGEAEGEKKE